MREPKEIATNGLPLHHKVARCNGIVYGKPCAKAEHCKRYVEGKNIGEGTAIMAPFPEVANQYFCFVYIPNQ